MQGQRQLTTTRGGHVTSSQPVVTSRPQKGNPAKGRVGAPPAVTPSTSAPTPAPALVPPPSAAPSRLSGDGMHTEKGQVPVMMEK